MSEAVKKNNRSAVASAAAPRLFVLEINAGRIHSMNTDGSDRKTIVSDCHLPDGIVVDAEAGHIYWTNMGIPNLNDGSVERADIDGKNRKVIVAKGATHTPKQIILDKKWPEKSSWTPASRQWRRPPSRSLRRRSRSGYRLTTWEINRILRLWPS
jgi:hypothetical protein